MSDTESAAAPETGAENGGQQHDNERQPEDQNAESEKDWKAEAEKWKSLSRKNESDLREARKAGAAAQTLEQQVNEMREQMAQRDLADIARNGRMAMTQVQSLLAQQGIKAEDASDLLEHVDPTRLLSEGDVDDKAVKRLAASLTKVAGRATPDPDQGRKGGRGPSDMNSMIRRMAGRR